MAAEPRRRQRSHWESDSSGGAAQSACNEVQSMPAVPGRRRRRLGPCNGRAGGVARVEWASVDERRGCRRAKVKGEEAQKLKQGGRPGPTTECSMRRRPYRPSQSPPAPRMSVPVRGVSEAVSVDARRACAGCSSVTAWHETRNVSCALSGPTSQRPPPDPKSISTFFHAACATTAHNPVCRRYAPSNFGHIHWALLCSLFLWSTHRAQLSAARCDPSESRSADINAPRSRTPHTALNRSRKMRSSLCPLLSKHGDTVRNRSW